MSQIIAVHGATGMQGGSVVKALLNSSEWKVRAITRNTTSASATALASQGVEVVSADFDDEKSLLKAYEVFLSLLYSLPSPVLQLMYGDRDRIYGSLDWKA